MSLINLINSKFTSISANRNPEFSGQVSTKTNIKIDDVLPVKSNKEILEVKYVFEVDYFELGKISLNGVLFIKTDQKTSKMIQKSWKEKRIENEDYIFITNLIIQKGSLKALVLEEELGFPIHVRLPKIDMKSN